MPNDFKIAFGIYKSWVLRLLDLNIYDIALF